MSLNSLVSIHWPAYYSGMWVESSRQFDTPQIQEARGETVEVSNPRGHSTRTLHLGNSECHVLWDHRFMTLQLGTPQTIWNSTHPESTGRNSQSFEP